MKTFFAILLLAFAMGYVSTNEPNTTTPTQPPTTAPTQTAAPTTASTPTTAPIPSKPAAGSWQVNDPNEICILAHMGVRFTFNWSDEQNKSHSFVMDLPSNANESQASGSCGSKSPKQQNLVISFQDKKWSLEFVFTKDEKSQFSTEKVVLNYMLSKELHPQLPTVKGTASLVNQTLFQAFIGKSYMCNTNQPYQLQDTSGSHVDVSMTTAYLQVQAFRTTNGTDFSTAQECSADAVTDNIVPIAVGAALAALVVIVLIAYLISRNRNKRGYESV